MSFDTYDSESHKLLKQIATALQALLDESREQTKLLKRIEYNALPESERKQRDLLAQEEARRKSLSWR